MTARELAASIQHRINQLGTKLDYLFIPRDWAEQTVEYLHPKWHAIIEGTNPLTPASVPRDRWIWVYSAKSKTPRVSAYIWEEGMGWYSGMGWWTQDQIERFYTHWAEMPQPPDTSELRA